MQYEDKITNFIGLSSLTNLTPEFIEKHKERWHWPTLSYNPAVTVDFIEKHPDWPWDWKGVAYNYNITLDFIEQNLDKPWDWFILSKNIGHPFKDVSHAESIRKKCQIISPLKDTYLNKVYLGAPVAESISYFPQKLSLALPFPVEIIHDISLWVYFQN